MVRQQHIVSAFTEELDQLSADILRMGGLAEAMIRDASRAVVNRDAALAEAVIERDLEMDRLERELEGKAVRMLALRQPMASDLRNVIGAIKLAGGIERIGDLAKNIARRSLAVMDEDNRSALRGVERMGQAVSNNLQKALDAYARRDAAAAILVLRQDDDIDSHYNGLLRTMLVFMAEAPDQLDARSNFLFIVKNLERIGDHATNIAKVVHFIATGERIVARETTDKVPEQS
ncbi:MAG: phosphate signaling complex protein PhoU [Hyphomonadaceae bacterium]|nr:phosphate signaling complex protein PhoU [Hyphomonadaceae bacterium]